IIIAAHDGGAIDHEELKLDIIDAAGNPHRQVRIESMVPQKRGTELTLVVRIAADVARADALFGIPGRSRRRLGRWRDFRLVQTHEAVDLRVVILAIDGGGYAALDTAIAAGGRRGVLKDMFGTASSAQFDPGPVMNSVPTVTFTNWATWLT